MRRKPAEDTPLKPLWDPEDKENINTPGDGPDGLNFTTPMSLPPHLRQRATLDDPCSLLPRAPSSPSLPGSDIGDSDSEFGDVEEDEEDEQERTNYSHHRQPLDRRQSVLQSSTDADALKEQLERETDAQGSLMEEEEEVEEEDSELLSGDFYAPPAWRRRLGSDGDSIGFGEYEDPLAAAAATESQRLLSRVRPALPASWSQEEEGEEEENEDGDSQRRALAQAMTVRLPASMSPAKGYTPEPNTPSADEVKVEDDEEQREENEEKHRRKRNQNKNKKVVIVERRKSRSRERSKSRARAPPPTAVATGNAAEATDEDESEGEVEPSATSRRKRNRREEEEKEEQSSGNALSCNVSVGLHADLRHRSESLESTFNGVRARFQFATRSWKHLFATVLVGFLSISALRSLFATPRTSVSMPSPGRPVPDLVKVAGIARSFEPLIYFSENGALQVGDLQATGVAVWDLSESIRYSNMTSADVISASLDEISDNLRTLAMELSKFVANVDGDVDGILIVMNWAKRELGVHVNSADSGSPSSFLLNPIANVHDMLWRAGLIEEEETGFLTTFGQFCRAFLGTTGPQRARRALHRTFTEFLSVLEEAVESELQHSLALFQLFESIDRQFETLGRTVVREASVQEAEHYGETSKKKKDKKKSKKDDKDKDNTDVEEQHRTTADDLSTLWSWMLGPRKSEIRKFERNKALLAEVRQRTVRNKGALAEHNGRLLALKSSLEALRRRLMSPIVRGVGSTALSLEDQIHGIGEVSSYLEKVRLRQKTRVMEYMYAHGGRMSGSGMGKGKLVIDESWKEGISQE